MPVKEDRFLLEDAEPAYLRLEADEWRKRAARGLKSLEKCVNCPRECGANRWSGGKGFCDTGRYAHVASAFPHHGEEDCIKGTRGSGTIFFGSCNLRCSFCQNSDISQDAYGALYPPGMLADLMLDLQEMGCHNINLVTPSHVGPQIIEALADAVSKGLHVPIVYNTSSFDSLETLRLFDGIVDIYMPDFKLWEPETSDRLCHTLDYPERARQALLEMHRQVGVLKLDSEGLARRGVLVRHLVMPGFGEQSAAILRWLAEALSPDTFVNIMAQYRPAHHVLRDTGFRVLHRRPTAEEIEQAYAAARQAGLWRFAR